MAIIDRKEREREDKRKLIISTATKLFREQGFEKVSLRNIAEAIEYSPTMIYLYFKDKNELFYYMHAEGFRMLRKQLESATENIEDAWLRFCKLGEVYIKFGLENPEYYELMFITSAPMQTEMTEDIWHEGFMTHICLETEVKNCILHGYFAGHDYKVLSLMVWCQVHGLVSLFIKDRMRMYQETEREKLMEQSTNLFMQLVNKLYD
jgi:AcrR family transcriptional regulator